MEVYKANTKEHRHRDISDEKKKEALGKFEKELTSKSMFKISNVIRRKRGKNDRKNRNINSIIKGGDFDDDDEGGLNPNII